MKNILNKLTLVTLLFMVCSCELDEVVNPNAPTYGSFQDGASQADVRLLAVGLEAIMRNDLAFHYQTVSILGREYYDLTGVDPRYTGEILKGPLDNNGFLTTRAFAAWYKIVQSANLLIEAVENSSAGFSDATKAGYFGYAQTLKGYALLNVLNRQYTNGIRIDVADPDNLGPFVGYEPALEQIMAILDEGNTNLQNSDEEFDFLLSSGFDGFDTPETFSMFNRAVAARVALYQEDYNEVLTLLEDSYLDLDGELYAGPKHVFGLSGNDIANALFYIPDQSGQEYMAHDSFVADAEAGDLRVPAKVDVFEGGPVIFDDLKATYQALVYKSNVDPVYLIRNEELILMYAEAQVFAGSNTEAVDAINIIRDEAGLDPYSGGTSDEELIDEILTQRRYSLFGEGHRWIDLRRFDRLNELPLDRSGDNIIPAFPTPVTENAGL